MWIIGIIIFVIGFIVGSECTYMDTRICPRCGWDRDDILNKDE